MCIISTFVKLSMRRRLVEDDAFESQILPDPASTSTVKYSSTPSNNKC